MRGPLRSGIGLVVSNPLRRLGAALRTPDGRAAAVTLRATLPHLTVLTAAERALLGDWLNRIAESQRVHGH